MICLTAVGGTAALFRAKSIVNNQLSVGYNTITIKEDFTPPKEMNTGENTYKKNVEVKNTGTVPCYVRVYVAFSDSNVADVSELSPDGSSFFSAESYADHLPEHWTYIEEPDDAEYSPNWLNTTEHFAYIIGYEDGTVRPDAGITRAEVATIFFRLLTDEARESFWSDTNDYSDVADGSWYNIAVSTLSNMGILGGYEDGTFRPNAPITRAEFAKIAVSFFDHEAIEAVNGFVDVARGAWYENYVAVAAEIGLIEGYGGNVFRPEAAITRAEACAIINRTLGRAPDAEHLLPVSQMNTWPDNADTGVWYYAHIQEATNSHDYSWIGDIEQWTEKLPEIDWDKFQY